MSEILSKSKTSLRWRLGPLWSLASLLLLVYLVTLANSFNRKHTSHLIFGLGGYLDLTMNLST